MTTIKTIEQVLALTPKQVSQVYEGGNHVCRCGCAGTYFATSNHTAPRSEVNDIEVLKLLVMAKTYIEAGATYQITDTYINIETFEESEIGKAITIYWDELKGVAL